MKAAENSFFNLKPNGQVQNYLKIVQAPNEPFLDYVERLCRLVELQIKDEKARKEVLKEIAAVNANLQCKAAILNLLMEPKPTIQDMLEVCEKKVDLATSEEPSTGEPAPRTGPMRRAYAANTRMPPPHPAPLPRSQRPVDCCFLCGTPGYWWGNCPLKNEFHKFKREQGMAQGPSKK